MTPGKSLLEKLVDVPIWQGTSGSPTNGDSYFSNLYSETDGLTNTKNKEMDDWEEPASTEFSDEFFAAESKILYWDNVSGEQNSLLKSFSNKTLKSMLGDLQKHHTKSLNGVNHHKPYMVNYDRKVAFINWRLAQ